MKLHQLPLEGAFASLRSRPTGLTDAEGASRLMEFGPNALDARRPVAPLRRFLEGFTHFFALILWLAALLAFIAEYNDPGQGMVVLGGAIIGVILINGTFSFWQEHRAERALQALQQLLPQQVTLRRQGQLSRVQARELVPGDVILLEAGDRVPADCRLIEGFGVRVNNASISGESIPRVRSAEPSAAEDAQQSGNVLLMGTTLVSGDATALVFATGMHTAFGQIAQLAQTAKEPLTPLQLEIVRLSRLVAALSLAMGGGFFLIGGMLGLPFWGNLIFAIGIIVANVPEGLLPTLTLAMAHGSQRMARRNALVRHLPAVETLGSATVICTDKTGTLTENRLLAARVWVDGRFLDEPEHGSNAILSATHRRLLEIARHNHSLKAGRLAHGSTVPGDPLEIALHQLAEAGLGPGEDWPCLHEIPFDSKRRCMSTLHQAPDGSRWLFTKGAPEAVLDGCTELGMGEGRLAMDASKRAVAHAAADVMAADGLRVLALTWRLVDAADRGPPEERQLILAGLVGLRDPLRPEVPAAIRTCRAAGIRVIMITGDHPKTAAATARAAGLVESPDPMVLTGEELAHLSNTRLQLALDHPEILFARVTAEQKTRIVVALRRKGEIVAVTGDGVNDAPALRHADIGIAMGRSGTDVAREAADVVLLDDNFATIVTAVEEGRAVYANIRKFLTYILTSNVPEIVPYIAYILFRIPLPLTIIQILAVDLGTDMLPALALGAEPASPGTMKEPPRRRGERLLNFALLARAYLWLGLMQAVAALSAYFLVLKAGGWTYGMDLPPESLLYRQATTACLSAIVAMQVVNVLVCRSPRLSVLASFSAPNAFIYLGIVVEIVLILSICYTPWGNRIFGTAPLPAATWLHILPFMGGMLCLEEARKWFVRRRACRPDSV